MQLRDYQKDTVKKLFDYLKKTKDSPLKSPVAECPTGSGKSVIIADIAKRVAASGQRVLVVTHSKELVEQNYNVYRSYDPSVTSVGIYSASLSRRETTSLVLFAGIQSVYDKMHEITAHGKIKLVIVDEAHSIPFEKKDESGMYRKMIEDIRAICPQSRLIGLTATPYRLDGGVIVGRDSIFDSIPVRIPLKKLLDEGYLSPIITPKDGELTSSYNIVKDGNTKEETSQKNIDDMVESQDRITSLAVNQIMNIGLEQNRKRWIVFACSIKHALRVNEMLLFGGIPSAVITSDTPSYDRDTIVKRFRKGDLRCIVNMSVLTTGFDVPDIDLVAILRPTQSTGLYVQMVGRGLRKAEGKENCLVLDYGQNIKRFGPIDEVRVKVTQPRAKKGEKKEYKICVNCLSEININSKICPECAYESPMVDKTKDETASTIEIISKEFESEVDDVIYSIHSKNGVSMLKADYISNSATILSEFVCIEHSGYAQTVAIRWICQRFPIEKELTIPKSAEQLLEMTQQMRRPVKIIYKFDENKYKKVKKVLEWSSYPTKQITKQEEDVISNASVKWCEEQERRAFARGEASFFD